MDNPCYKYCPERAMDCHTRCERYERFRKNLDEKNAEIRKSDCIAAYHSAKKKEKAVKDFKYPIHYKGGGQN